MWLRRKNYRKIGLFVFVFTLSWSVCHAGKPARVISLDLCTDWMLLTYADPANVRALSPLSKQHFLDGKPHALPVHNGSLEHILALEPDLVVSGEFNAPLLRQRLQSLGIRVVAMPQATALQQVRDYERNFIALLGGSANTPVELQPRNYDPDQAPSLLLLGANAGATGTGTLEHEIIRAAGWKNYVSESGYITLELERLIELPPDVIMWSAPASPALANHFKEHPALKKVIADDNWLQTDFGGWQCQGPWTWQRITELQQARQAWLTGSR